MSRRRALALPENVSNAGGSRTHKPPRFELGRFAGLRTAPSVKRPVWGSNPPASGRRPDRDPSRVTRQIALAGSGSGGSRTHSIRESDSRWSADCLPSHVSSSARRGSRTPRHPGLSRVAQPVGVAGRPHLLLRPGPPPVTAAHLFFFRPQLLAVSAAGFEPAFSTLPRWRALRATPHAETGRTCARVGKIGGRASRRSVRVNHGIRTRYTQIWNLLLLPIELGL